MSYATVSELCRRIGSNIFEEIYRAEGQTDFSADPAALEDLESAGAEIDGAIACRYRLPVDGAQSLALLKDWNLTLAEERAFARPAGGAYTEKVKLRVAQVRKYLDMIRADQFRLPDAAEKGSGSGTGRRLAGQMRDTVFGLRKPERILMRTLI